MTCWCPCVTVGRIANIVDQGSSSCCATGALYMLSWSTVFGSACISCKYRARMRRQYNLKGGDCGDYLKHFCCELCALTQAYRELTKRGFDVPLGWDGNVARHNAGVAMGAPVVEGGMRRWIIYYICRTFIFCFPLWIFFHDIAVFKINVVIRFVFFFLPFALVFDTDFMKVHIVRVMCVRYCGYVKLLFNDSSCIFVTLLENESYSLPPIHFNFCFIFTHRLKNI